MVSGHADGRLKIWRPQRRDSERTEDADQDSLIMILDGHAARSGVRTGVLDLAVLPSLNSSNDGFFSSGDRLLASGSQDGASEIARDMSVATGWHLLAVLQAR